MNNQLPIFMHDSKNFEILKDAKFAIPKNAKAYLVGGAPRNALYFKLFNKKLPERDYDILFVGNKDNFVKNLRSRGFVYGEIKRKNEIVLKKKKIPKPNRKSFSDYVYLDIHFSDENSVLKNLKENANFTINGFALSLKDVDSENWHKKIISLPNAMKDLENRKLHINIISHPANLFACLRFMSKGFKKPSKEDIKKLLFSLKKLEKYKFKRNVNKVFDYVGGEKEARKLAKRLGIKKDIFNFKIIEKLHAQN